MHERVSRRWLRVVLVMAALAGAPTEVLATDASDGQANTVERVREAAIEHERQRDFPAAARAWARLARMPTGDDSLRELALFRADDNFARAYACSGDPVHLCDAHGLLHESLERAHEPNTARDLRARQVELRDTLLLLAERRGVDVCTGAERTGQAALLSVAPPRSSSLEGSAPASAPAPAATLDQPAKNPVPLLVSGGVLTAIGVGLMGAMTYGLLEMDRAAQRTTPLMQMLEEEQRPLSMAERQIFEALHDDYQRARTLAITTGILGGVTAASGVALLIIGAKQRRERAVSVVPSASPGSAGVVIHGRF